MLKDRGEEVSLRCFQINVNIFKTRRQIKNCMERDRQEPCRSVQKHFTHKEKDKYLKARLSKQESHRPQKQ